MERTKPRILGVPPGADFVRCLFERINRLSDSFSPENTARMQVLVPTRRMQRRLKHLFEQSDRQTLLPRVGLVTDVSHLLPHGRHLQPISGLRRVLELKDVVAKLVTLDSRLSQSDVIDLTASLTDLLDEMHGEDIGFDSLEALQPDDQSGHWAQSLTFLRAIRSYVETLSPDKLDGEALHRTEVEELCSHWEVAPPDHSVILAGSTGSRATTRRLMEAVAALPKGEVILPGFDFCLPASVWSMISESRDHEDHPQYRFAAFLNEVGCSPAQVEELGAAPMPQLGALVSLSLRPAPVTDAWLEEGPRLGPLEKATSNLSLIEARDPKEEALAIALFMRKSLEERKSVALIAPDATLSRRVTACLSRWDVRPDDSGGVPLSLTPYGRFLRHTLQLASGESDTVDLMALLKHPMTRAGDERGELMRRVQELELFIRRRKVPEVTTAVVRLFGNEAEADPEWIEWLISVLAHAERRIELSLAAAFEHHMTITRMIAGSTPIAPNEEIDELLARFREEATAIAKLDFREYAQLFERALAGESARQQDGVRPDVMIWGSLEARVQGADAIILAGLNEGVWPSEPNADPWLNRSMRRQVGLLLPERQIGLAAHDYQQAIGAKEVLLTRSARSEGSETVASRWLSRLTNLLEGLEDNGGKDALNDMRARGKVFLQAAQTLDGSPSEIKSANRPAPSPPISARPRQFAVTDIKTLIQDPYAIYAKRVLRLQPINALRPEADARERGIIFHSILEKFFDPAHDFHDANSARHRLLEISDTILRQEVFDPTARAEWLALFKANANWLITGEIQRRTGTEQIAREVEGSYQVPDTNFVLVGKADRIDRYVEGGLVIYDYKTGTPPSAREVQNFDRQLVLEAVMAEAGAFTDVMPENVRHVTHIGVGRTPKESTTSLVGENETVTVSGQISTLLSQTLEPAFGFVSGRAVESRRFEGAYDHLARFGEWEPSQPANPEPFE